MVTRSSSLLAEVPDLPGHEVRRLFLAATGRSAAYLVGDPEVTRRTQERFAHLVERRRRGEPLQYIEGSVQFGPIELRVDRRALIPRPETESLWEVAVSELAAVASPTIVDLCTGTGNLALALRHAIPSASVTATDLSPDAVELARHNATELGLDVTFAVGDLFGPLPTELLGRVDLIVSNPPYIAEDEYAELPDEIRDHEPMAALVAGPDGLDVLRRIATQARDWLRPGGVVVCEIGESQGSICLELFATFKPRILQDLTGRDRFVLGYAPMLGNVH